MQIFTVYRKIIPDHHNADQANPPDEPQFEGVIFSDGTVAVRWLTAKKSTSVWGSMEDLLAVHGHPEYDTEVVWHNNQEMRSDMEELLAYAHGNDQCDDADSKKMHVIQKRWNLE